MEDRRREVPANQRVMYWVSRDRREQTNHPCQHPYPIEFCAGDRPLQADRFQSITVVYIWSWANSSSSSTDPSLILQFSSEKTYMCFLVVFVSFFQEERIQVMWSLLNFEIVILKKWKAEGAQTKKMCNLSRKLACLWN